VPPRICPGHCHSKHVMEVSGFNSLLHLYETRTLRWQLLASLFPRITPEDVLREQADTTYSAIDHVADPQIDGHAANDYACSG